MIDITTIGLDIRTDGLERGRRYLGEAERAANRAADAATRAGAHASSGFREYGSAAAIAERQTRALADTTATFGRLMGTVFAGMGAGALIGQIDAYTKYTAQLRLATTGATEFAASMDSVRRIAATAQADLASTGVLYARISNSTREMGIGQKQVAAITETVGLSLKVSGASAGEAASAMLQLSQAFGSGRLNGQEFAAIAEAAPGLLQILADSLGVSRGALKAMSEEGKLTTEVMVRAFGNPDVITGLRAHSKEVETIGGAFTVLKNNVLEFVGVQAHASGVVSALTGGIGALANNLDMVTAAALGLATAKIGQVIGDIGVKAATAATGAAAYTQAQLAQRNAAIAAAQAELAAANAIAARLTVTQAALVLARQEAMAALQRANASATAAQSQIAAARAAGAQSFAIASLRQGEVALAAAITARSAATAELAILGAQAARMTTQQTAAAVAQTAAQNTLTAAQRTGSLVAGVASTAMAALGGPVAIITTLLGLGVTAWMLWGRAAKDGSAQAEQTVLEKSKAITATLRAEIALIDKRNAALNYKPSVNGTDEELSVLEVIEGNINALRAKAVKNQTEEVARQREINALLAQRGEQEQAMAENAAKAATQQARKDAAGQPEALLEARRKLLGVGKEYEAQLKTLSGLHASGAMGLEEYRDHVNKLATDTYNGSVAGKAAAEATKNGASAAKSAESAYASLISSINQKIEAERLEAATGKDATASQKMRIKLDQDLAAGSVKLGAAEESRVRAALDVLATNEEMRASADALRKSQADLTSARDKEAMASAGDIAKIHEKAQALEDEAAAYGKTAVELQALTIARLEEKKVTLFLFDPVASQDEIAKIDEMIAGLTRLGAAGSNLSGIKSAADESKQALEALNNFLDPSRAEGFGDALKGAFEGAGSALAGLVNAFDDYARKEAEIEKMRGNLSKETDQKKAAKDAIALSEMQAKAQISAYASMAGAAKGFFKEGTGGYKVMGAAEKAFRAVELASAVQNMAVKMGLIGGEVAATAAGQGAMTASSAAGEAMRMPAKIAGAFASFMSMMGPFGIPAAIAAFAAVGIMASGSSSNTLPATNDGTGTVFGDASAKSESIEKTLDLLEGISKFAGIENSYAAKMLTSLRSIEQQIGGFTNVILRSGGIDSVGADMAAASASRSGSGVNWGIDGLSAKIDKALFGKKVTVTGQGLYADDASLNQIAAGGLTAGYYTDVNTKKKAFGITYSDKNRINKTQDDEVSRQISLIITNFEDAVKQAGPVLGMSLDTIDANLQDFVLKMGRIDLKDLTGTEIQEKLNAVFGAAGDDIARAAIPGLEHLQQVGEGYFETLARVASNLSSVNQMFDTLSVKLFDASIAGAEMSVNLADLFGGLENMASVVGDYYENFYSEEERKATMQRQLSAAFADLQLTMPDIDAGDARAQFRALAQAQDLSTEAGRKAYASLLQLSGAFASITTSAEDAAAALAEAAKQAAEAAAEAARNAIDSAYRSLQNAAALERKQLDIQRTLANESVSMLTSVFKLVRDNAQALYGQVETTAAMQAAQGFAFIDEALRTARTNGGIPDRDALGTAITAARSGLDGGDYASQFDRDFDRLVLAGKLSDLGDITGVQLTTAEQQLKGIEKQIRQQDGMLAYWKRQIDIARGNVDATMSVAEAVRKLHELLPSAVSDGKAPGPATPPPYSGVQGAGADAWKYGQGYAGDPKNYQEEYNYGRGPGSMDVFDASQIAKLSGLRAMLQAEYGSGTPDDLARVAGAAKGMGATMADIGSALGFWESDIQAIFAGVGIPAFAVGTNYVPSDMVAQIHQGERIIPAADNRALMQMLQGGGQGNTARLEALVGQLVEDNRRQAGEITRLNLRMARVLEKWDGDGTPQPRDERAMA